VNANLSALKLGARLQIDRRLWINGKLYMMIDLWDKKHWEYRKQPMATKNWKKLVDKINVAFLHEVSCTWK
jgi:hypothetical protein